MMLSTVYRLSELCIEVGLNKDCPHCTACGAQDCGARKVCRHAFSSAATETPSLPHEEKNNGTSEEGPL